MNKCSLAIGIAAVAALSLAGCSLYNHSFDTPDVSNPNYDLRIVQSDDFGTFWDGGKAADSTLDFIDDLAKQNNVLVVLFIHGWHHNAAEDDPNLCDFKQTLEALGSSVRTEARRKLRADLTGSEDVRIVGIYVGWRGRSLPGVLDYATMWWRKSAAERVGDGDISEFIERLDRIYLRRNAATIDTDSSQKKRTMGLVTIGHSFGGQVLLRSIARTLEYSLAERAPYTANILRPPAAESANTPVRVPVDSLGDLNILVNPAAEAYQFARIDSLYKQLIYPRSQTPQLVVFSADNDVPRSAFFPIARGLTRLFRPPFRSDDDSYQGELWGHAIGEVDKQQTHSLVTAEPGDHPSLEDTDYTTPDGRNKILNFDFANQVTFKNVSLVPSSSRSTTSPAAAATPNSPVIVATTHDNIIDGHNGIFGAAFRDFLIEYVAFVEGKRFLLKAQEHEQLRAR